MGQFMVTLATVLFAFAQFLPTSLAFPSYVVAKGLQGMSGIGIIQEIVTGDVALRLNDTVAVYGRRQVLINCLFVVLTPLNLYMQWVEIADFTYAWAAMVVVNLAALALSWRFFPETLQRKKDVQQFSVMAMVKEEVQNFRALVRTHDYISIRIVEELFSKMAAPDAIVLPFLMANFQFSQFDALVVTALPGILGGISLSWLVPTMCAKLGHKKVMRFCLLYYRLSGCILSFLLPFRFLGIPVPLIGMAMHLPLSGLPAVAQGIEIRVIRQENNAKFQAC